MTIEKPYFILSGLMGNSDAIIDKEIDRMQMLQNISKSKEEWIDDMVNDGAIIKLSDHVYKLSDKLISEELKMMEDIDKKISSGELTEKHIITPNGSGSTGPHLMFRDAYMKNIMNMGLSFGDAELVTTTLIFEALKNNLHKKIDDNTYKMTLKGEMVMYINSLTNAIKQKFNS